MLNTWLHTTEYLFEQVLDFIVGHIINVRIKVTGYRARVRDLRSTSARHSRPAYT